MAGYRWTDEEILIVRLYYGTIPAREIARIINRMFGYNRRSPEAVKQKAFQLGLKSDIRGKMPDDLTDLIIKRRYNKG